MNIVLFAKYESSSKNRRSVVVQPLEFYLINSFNLTDIYLLDLMVIEAFHIKIWYFK